MSIFYRPLRAHLVIVPPGVGRLSGTLKEVGPPEAPVQRLVQLFTAENAHGQLFPTSAAIDWQWSTPAGDWAFSGLDPAKKYNVIAYDHTGMYDPVVKLNLIPTVP